MKLKPFLKVRINKIIDGGYPGYVQCKFMDIALKEHLFEEKIPILTAANITNETRLPLDGYLECEILDTKVLDNGDEILYIDVEAILGVTTYENRTKFQVFASQIVFEA